MNLIKKYDFLEYLLLPLIFMLELYAVLLELYSVLLRIKGKLCMFIPIFLCTKKYFIAQL